MSRERRLQNPSTLPTSRPMCEATSSEEEASERREGTVLALKKKREMARGTGKKTSQCI